jgi:flagellar basal-body rod protein FlgF
MGLLGTAVSALSGAERRVEIAARNVANATTPGYKREVAFAEIVEAVPRDGQLASSEPRTGSVRHHDQAILIESGNPLDLAIDGDGFVLVRQGDRLFASRGGQFRMADDGRLIDADGRSLQQAGGGDLVIEAGALTVHADGTALVDELPMGAVGFYAGKGLDGSDWLAGVPLEHAGLMEESERGELRQGMLERSNVALSDEMVGLMQTQRMAEAAAQLIRAYDQLTASAAATFNRSGR